MLGRIAVFICSFLLIANLTADTFSTPTGQVRDSVERVLKILKDTTLDRDQKWEKIGVIINERFDFRSMSQSILATNWKRATPEEREKFVEYFSQYIEETYRDKIEAYDNQEIRFVDEKIYGKRALVKMMIVTENTEIPIDFRVKDNDGEWYSYDVVIEGVSLVNNYRNTFATILKNEGMDGLLNDISRRVQKYKEKQAAGDSPG
jgi:phospholipid transport system substrate-binding protein